MKTTKRKMLALLLAVAVVANSGIVSAEMFSKQNGEKVSIQEAEYETQEIEKKQEDYAGDNVSEEEYSLSVIGDTEVYNEETIVYGAANDFVPGDLNGDKKVNTVDVVLFGRYLAGTYNVSINEGAADVNADGNCNTLDLTLLRKYLAGGYDAELKNSAENTYSITYHLYDGDTYLETLEIENKNPTTYRAGQAVKLANLSVPGCVFEGWYDGQGSFASLVKEISADEIGDKVLYARWSFIEYTVQFDSPLYAMKSKTYTTNTGTTLENPTLSGYIFTGWTNDKNEVITRIEKGTVGNITLHANWCSKRNQARPVSELGDPVIYFDEELNCIQFVYKIGTIENVPLYEIEYLGNKVDGVTFKKTTTSSGSISNSTANTVAEIVANATTNSSTWTLSKDWNVTEINSETHESEAGSSTEDSNENGSENESGGSIEGGSGGSTSGSTTSSIKIGSKISSELGVEGAKIGGEISGEEGIETTSGYERTWNTSVGYTATNKTTSNNRHMTTLSQKTRDSLTKSTTSSFGGYETNSTALATTATETRECASAFNYSTEKTETSTIEYSNENAPEGYYRVVCAGTLHVCAVVNYDIASKAYGVFTYSLLEDETKDFLDYSRISSNFDDNINGTLPFEVPIFVDKYVESVVGNAENKGFVIDLDNGEIVDYLGEEKELIIPDYITADNGDGSTSVVKVTGFDSNAFAGKNITSIQLCENITQIPNNAFKNCFSLTTVTAPGVTSIGTGAFSGCTSLGTYTISDSIVSVGTAAFTGVKEVKVEAANVSVAQNMIVSGAKKITLNVSSLGESLNDLVFEVPDNVDSITLNGDGGTYSNFRIISNAGETIINRINFAGNAPALKTISSKVTLNRTSMESAGFALVLDAYNTEVALNGTVQVKSSSDNAVLCRNVSLKRMSANVVGKLNVTGNIMTCNAVTDNSLLTFASGKIIPITLEEYLSLYNNNWSDWSEWTTTPITSSLYTEVETKVQYQYSDKQTTTSTNSALSGWTQSGSEIQYGAWGGWSAWNRDYVASSDTREVNTSTVYGYYYFLCPNCGNHMHVHTTCFTWAGGCGSSVLELSNGVNIFDPTPHSSVGLYNFHGTGKYATDYFPQYGRVFKWTDNGQSSWTGYQYRDRTKTIVYSYYKWSDWSAWSDTVYTSSSTRNVQTRTLYRSRTRQ